MNDVRAPFRATSASLVFPDLEPTSAPQGVRDSISAVTVGAARRSLPAPARKTGHVRATTMSFRNMHEHGELLVNYLEARKSIFVDQLRWHVPEVDGMEFDQYDTPYCRWIVLHEFGEVLAGVRVMPTTAKCGIYSYMLRDAQKGILVDIPTDVLFFEAPVEHRIWEASRFFVSSSVPAKRRIQLQSMLFENMSRTALENGATHILGIVPDVWSRWARRLDVGATPIGAKFSIDGTISQSVLFNASSFVN
jgi:N-acyl-L-homoserine lactone synthetase